MPGALTNATTNVTESTSSQRGFRRLWRTLKQLFYEMTGALFAILALAWLNNAFRAWNRDVAHWLLAIAVAVAGIFVFFAVSSFRRARKL